MKIADRVHDGNCRSSGWIGLAGLLAFAAVGCSSLDRPRSVSVDDAIRQVELAKPASRLATAEANSPASRSPVDASPAIPGPPPALVADKKELGDQPAAEKSESPRLRSESRSSDGLAEFKLSRPLRTSKSRVGQLAETESKPAPLDDAELASTEEVDSESRPVGTDAVDVAEAVRSPSQVDGVVALVPRIEPVGGGAKPVEVVNGIGLTGSAEIDSAALVELLASRSAVETVSLKPVPNLDSAGSLIADSVLPEAEVDEAIQPVSAEVPVPSPPEPIKSDALEIGSIQLCEEILGFGNVVSRPAGPLGHGERVLVYVEVRHQASVEVEGAFQTTLGAAVTLVDGDGQEVFQQPFVDIVDRCPSPRRDFFCHCLFTVPAGMPTGAYTLRLTLTDRVSQATSNATMPVLVGASPNAKESDTP